MKQYRLFVATFVLSILALVIFFAAYFHGLMKVIHMGIQAQGLHEDPFYFFRTIFSPALLISFPVLLISGLIYRLLGIIFIAGNTKLSGGEQAMWIIGFVIAGFITAIVFIVMAKGRGFLPLPEDKAFGENR